MTSPSRPNGGTRRWGALPGRAGQKNETLAQRHDRIVGAVDQLLASIDAVLEDQRRSVVGPPGER